MLLFVARSFVAGAGVDFEADVIDGGRHSVVTTTVADLIRIVGRLDKKISVGFQKQDGRMDGFDKCMDSFEGHMQRFEEELTVLKANSHTANGQLVEMKGMLASVLEKLYSMP